MKNEESVTLAGFLPDGTHGRPGTLLTDEGIHDSAPLLAELFEASLAREAEKKREA